MRIYALAAQKQDTMKRLESEIESIERNYARLPEMRERLAALRGEGDAN
jgi:UDP-N-acetylglucosamine:LPS N-acetylglucosamine transferase